MEVAPRVDAAGVVSYRSFENCHLGDNLELPRAVVATLQPDTLYSLYGTLGRHDGDGAPIAWTHESEERGR